MSSKPLKGSANYIWWEKDELGKGATATVYKCREKKTGDVFAVKVFSNRHRERHESTQQEREFDLLKRLNHENIVRMLAIEEESQTDKIPSRVIIMEYCNAGSLYSILEKPENAYGLPEQEFLLFLRHISEGLRYIREQKVVHRDIKPGNILKLETAEGRSIYKLTDFGAARKLEEDDESFTSLYGTEEYLHPDLYDRAVVRQPYGAKKSFTSSVDLWSVGVTLFHVATGSLPFRPVGGRKNRSDMHRILSQKQRFDISGVCEKAGGQIDYSSKLPPTCTISQGLQMLIVPIIAGLLEVDMQFCMDFEEFFARSNSIVRKSIVTVFDSCHCKLLKVYCDPRDDLNRVRDLIEKQTTYKSSDQLLLYENSRLDDLVQDIEASHDRFPVTSDNNPVFLYHCNESLLKTDESPTKHHIPKFSRFASAYDLEKDYQLAKTCTGIMKYICGKVKLTLSMQNSLDRSVKIYENYLIRMVIQLRDNIMMVIGTANEVRMRYSFMKNIALMHPRNQGDTETRLAERFTSLQNKIEEMATFIKDLQKYGDDYKEKLADRKELSHKWRRSSGCDPEKDMCYARVASLTGNVSDCMSAFQIDRRLKTLPYNEEQIHKFEKNKMSECCTSALSLLDDHCWDRTKKMYRLFIQWFQMAFRIQTKINKLKAKMERLQALQTEVSRDLNDSDYDLVRMVSTRTVQPVAPLQLTGGRVDHLSDTGLGGSDLFPVPASDNIGLGIQEESIDKACLLELQQITSGLDACEAKATENDFELQQPQDLPSR